MVTPESNYQIFGVDCLSVLNIYFIFESLERIKFCKQRCYCCKAVRGQVKRSVKLVIMIELRDMVIVRWLAENKFFLFCYM